MTKETSLQTVLLFCETPPGDILVDWQAEIQSRLVLKEVTERPQGPSYFEWSNQGLCFHHAEFGKLYLDFVNDHINYSRKSHRGKNELIAKALGLGKGTKKIFDSTVGLAQDSFFLARLGAEVMGWERSPFVYLLLQDARRRFVEQNSELPLVFRFGDSIENLSCRQFDAVYVDPMFPEKKKSALPRKEMRIFKDLVGEDLDGAMLAQRALLFARRVVVKRPLRAEPLLPNPQHSFEGTTVRYDLYVNQQADETGEAQ